MVDSRKMACCVQAWEKWLTGYHPVVAGDIKMMEAGAESILISFS
jgi:hypothetical protein